MAGGGNIDSEIEFNAECLSLLGNVVVQNQGILDINENLTTTGELTASGCIPFRVAILKNACELRAVRPLFAR